MAEKKAAAKKPAAKANDEADFAQAQPPRHERVEFEESVDGVDGRLDVATSRGTVRIEGDAILGRGDLQVLMVTLERARQAL